MGMTRSSSRSSYKDLVYEEKCCYEVVDCFCCPDVLLCRDQRRQRVLPPQQWLWLWLCRSGSVVLRSGPVVLRSGSDLLRSGPGAQLLRSGPGPGSCAELLRSGPGSGCAVLLCSGPGSSQLLRSGSQLRLWLQCGS
jgi:hypothetical protein